MKYQGMTMEQAVDHSIKRKWGSETALLRHLGWSDANTVHVTKAEVIGGQVQYRGYGVGPDLGNGWGDRGAPVVLHSMGAVWRAVDPGTREKVAETHTVSNRSSIYDHASELASAHGLMITPGGAQRESDESLRSRVFAKITAEGASRHVSKSTTATGERLTRIAALWGLARR